MMNKFIAYGFYSGVPDDVLEEQFYAAKQLLETLHPDCQLVSSDMFDITVVGSNHTLQYTLGKYGELPAIKEINTNSIILQENE